MTEHDWSPSNFTSGAGVYHLEWGDIYATDDDNQQVVIPIPHWITMTVSRVLEDSKQNVTGEVAVMRDKTTLHRARLNLTSSTSRRAFAKELVSHSLYSHEEWMLMLGHACTMTLDKYREGEPIVQLGNLAQLPPLEYTLYPLIIKDAHNVLFGDGGTGKTYLADLVAILVHHNTEHLGLKPLKGNVLILDWETSRETHERRAEAIKAGLGLTGPSFFYRFCEQTLANEVEQIREMVLANNITLVIADSAGMAAGFDGDYHQSAIRYARALRSLRVTSLSIDHITKSEGDKPFGSVYKTNIARNGFKIRHSSNPEEQDLYIGLYHHKHNDSPKHHPFGFHIHFEGNHHNTTMVTFEPLNVADIPELANGLSQREQIIHILQRGAMTKEAITENTGISIHNVRTILNKYKDTFVQTESGWGLLSNVQ